MTKLMPFLSLLFITCFSSGFSQNLQSALQNQEIGIIEHLGDTVDLSIKLIDEEFDTVDLGSLLDKPTIINFVYYRCPGICSPIMSALGEVIDLLDLTVGKDFNAFTISFDPTENTELAINKKANYLELMQKQEEAEKGWRFFTSDSASIINFTNATGFKYKRVGRDFNHTAALIVLSSEGKITRYIKPGLDQYGEKFYFQPFDVKMSILDAAEGRVRSTINKVLVFCYNYNPDGQKWVFNLTKVSGVIIGFFALIFFLILALRSKFKKSSELK